MSKKNRRDRALAQESAPAASAEQASQLMEELVDFDGWWAARSSKIPSHHHKEIVKADFRGRGLSMMETMEDFDDALKEYGLVLS